ncbi:MAG: hypothetical protein LC750_07635 [Actinobacteria bacterium]|nr:hypothetical protein [Actinomycetota bacterium]
MGLGGPVWHASVANQRKHHPDDEMRLIALAVLKGLGDADLGQWEERGVSAFHMRRRLSDEEAVLVGPVVDIRRTDEAGKRLFAVRKQLAAVGMTDWAYEEEGPGWKP